MNKFFKLTWVLLAVSLVGMGCANKKAQTTTPRNDFKGTWVITNTTVEGTDTKNLNVEAFDDARLNCFTGSQWVLPNNGYGNYTINSSDCSPGVRQILWSTRNNNGKTYFNFKRVDGLKKNQSKNVAEGYSLEVISANKSHFIAQTPISFEGKTIYIVYEFEKR